MKKLVWVMNLAIMVGALLLWQGAAEAGTVTMTNNFSNTVRADIWSGTSKGSLTAYAGETRDFTFFVSKSIEKIVVVNTASGATLVSYTVSSPSASTNYKVLVDGSGVAAVTVSLLP